MNVKNARWTDAAHTVGAADIGGVEHRGITAGAVWLWSAFLESGPTPYAPTADDVKAEAGRRINLRYPLWRQSNMNMRANELQEVRIAGGTLTPEEQAEADALKAAATWIKSVRDTSDALEAMSPVPVDYADNAYWPT